jgi:hypothetical protein
MAQLPELLRSAERNQNPAALQAQFKRAIGGCNRIPGDTKVKMVAIATNSTKATTSKFNLDARIDGANATLSTQFQSHLTSYEIVGRPGVGRSAAYARPRGSPRGDRCLGDGVSGERRS